MPQITRLFFVALVVAVRNESPDVGEGVNCPFKQGPRDWLCQTAGAAPPSGGSEPHAVGSVGALNLANANCTCTPRLLPSSSCHSSTTTMRTLPSTSRASVRASKSDRLSGVVTSTVGSRLFCALRSALAVSPLRAPAVQFRPIQKIQRLL